MAATYQVSSIARSVALRNERSLIRFSQSGDRDAFGLLYETYLKRIYRYVYFRVFDRELAEDIASLVFLKAWEHLGSFEGGQIPFAKWLYRVAHNTVIDYYRTRKPVSALEHVHPLRVSYADGVDEKIDLDIFSSHLVEALKELTDGQREVLILRFIGGLTTQEIARRIDKGLGAVRALQMRGLRRLAQNPAIQKVILYER